MKRIVIALGIAMVSAPAMAGMPALVPEMDGGLALAAGAIVMGVGALVYEKYFRK
jgi:hypothetical protein